MWDIDVADVSDYLNDFPDIRHVYDPPTTFSGGLLLCNHPASDELNK